MRQGSQGIITRLSVLPGQSVLGHLLPLFLSAVLLGLAFPRPGWGWLVWIALVPAGLVAVGSEKTWRLIWTSYAAALAWWLVMLSWLWPVTGGGYALLAGYMALYMVLGFFGARVLYRFWRLPMTLALPMAWVSFEWMRGQWLQGGFAWFNLGHPLAPWQPTDRAVWVIQIADLFGDYAVSFVAAMTSGMLIDGLIFFMPTKGQRPARQSAVGMSLWCVVMSLVLGYGWYRVEQTPAYLSPGPMVAVVQTNVPQSNKLSRSEALMQQDWDELFALSHEALAGDPPVDVLVWPETVVPAPLNRDAVALYKREADWLSSLTPAELAKPSVSQAFERRAAQLGVPVQQVPVIMAGMYRKWVGYGERIAELATQHGTAIFVGAGSEFQNPRPARFNSVFLYHADGRRDPLRYDKMHRVPFGEYIPWVEDWPWLKRMFMRYVSPYDFDYSLRAGTMPVVFQTTGRGGNDEKKAWRFATPICYEDVPAWVLLAMVNTHPGAGGELPGADVIVNLTNDAWYGGAERTQHFQIAVFRSIEHRMPTARSVNTGVSGFIDSLGRVGPIVSQSGQREHVAGIARHRVMLDRRVTWFSVWGQWPVKLLAGLTVVMLLVAEVGRRVFKAREYDESSGDAG